MEYGKRSGTDRKIAFLNNYPGEDANTLYSADQVSLGEWHQVAATYDGTTKKLYIDGALSSSASWGKEVVWGGSSNEIGRGHQDGYPSFDGKIDDVRIYNRALSATEVKNLANGLVAHWTFDDGSGTTAADSSGNGNTGTVSGATWTTGVVGSGALSFDGVDDLFDSGYSGDQYITVNMWVKLATGASGYIIDAAHDDIGAKGICLQEQTDGLGMRLSVFADATAIDDYKPGFTWGIYDQWSMLTLSWDGSTAKVYRNGTEYFQSSGSGGIDWGGYDLVLGSSYDGTSNTPIQAVIDDVRVYNHALSSSEVASLYSAVVQTATISATDSTASETGPDTGTFTVTLSSAPSSDVTVNYTVSGTATSGTDYTALAGTVTVSSGQTTGTITVTPVTDSTAESAETVIVTLASGTGYTVGMSSSDTVTIAQSYETYTASIGLTTGQAPLVLNKISAGTFTMGSPERDGDAEADEKPQHSVTLTQDFYMGVYEITQAQWSRYTTNPSSFSGDNKPVEMVSWNDAQGFLTWLNQNDTAKPSGWEYRLPTEAEWEYCCRAGSTTIYGFSDTADDLGDYGWYLSNSSSSTHDVGGKLPNGWGLYDVHGNVWEWCQDWHDTAFYNSTAATENDPENTTEASSRVLRGASWNDVAQNLRSANRSASNPDSGRTNYFGMRVVLAQTASEPSATVSATDSSASETGPDTGTFTVTLSSAPTSDVTVGYTVSGTATNGTDYTTIAESVTIAAGQTTGTITITPIDDSDDEDDETVTIILSNGTGYTLGSTVEQTVTIADNDEATPSATVAATDATASEANSATGTFTVTLSSAPTSSVTVNYTVSGTATAGTDYTALAGTVTIASGQTTGTMTVTPTDDITVEGDETVIVTLATGTGYTVGTTSTATVTIADNDVPAATISATDSSASETGPDTGTFTVTLSSAPTSDVTVNYTASGTATSGTDYTALAGTVTIAAGQTTGTITVTPVDDTTVEADETVVVTLTAGTGYSAGGEAEATVTIADDDVPTATITETDTSAAEEGPDTGTLTISLSEASSTDVTVNYTVSGTATPSTDYTALSGTATVSAGQTSTTLTVTPTDDSEEESAETVVVTLATGTGYALGTATTGTVTILDNDASTEFGITGQVTRGGQGVANCWIDVFDATTSAWKVNTKTDALGNYTLYPLEAGSYTVRAYDPSTHQPADYSSNPVTVSGANVTGVDIALSTTYAVTGQVTRGGQGVADCWLDIFTEGDRKWVDNTQTDSSGNYSLGPVSDGSYTVHAYDPQTGQEVAYESNPVTVNGAAVSDINIDLDSSHDTYTLSGQVLRSSSGVSSAWVDLFTGTGTWVANTQTDSSGNYSFTKLDAGSYSVYAYDPDAFNAQTAYSGNPVTIASSNVSGIDISFTSLFGISGQVTRAGSGVENAWVDVFTSTGTWVKNGQTDSSGNYAFTGLDAGSYSVYAYDPANFNNQTAYGSNPVTLSSSSATGIDIAFVSTYALSGQVTRSGTGVANAWVDLFTESGTWVKNMQTDSSGNYSFSSLAAGSYKVYAYDPYNDLAQTAYGSNPVTISSSDVSGIDIAFSVSTYSISGQVTRAGSAEADCWIDAFNATTLAWVGNTKTDASGNYTLSGLSAGSYTIKAYDPNTRLPVEYSSNPVAVSSSNVTGIDISLGAGYTVSGQVTRGNQEIDECWLDIFTYGDHTWVGNTQTDANGNYTLGPVTDGSYTVHAYDPQTKQEVPYRSNPIEVSGADVTSIDISLPASGK